MGTKACAGVVCNLRKLNTTEWLSEGPGMCEVVCPDPGTLDSGESSELKFRDKGRLQNNIYNVTPCF